MADSRPGPGDRKHSSASADGALADVVAPGLEVLFCGINPGRRSALAGHHYAGPGNRFWRALHEAGFTPRRLSPEEDRRLPEWGLGLTNLAHRMTPRADQLSRRELRQGATRLGELVERLEPRWVAFIGLGAYRIGFRRPRARPGEQVERLAEARIWLLPSTSGLNAGFPLADLVERFRELRIAVDRQQRSLAGLREAP